MLNEFGVQWSELPSSQNLQTINAGGGGQQFSYTVGGSANQYSHYGEVYGGSLKVKSRTIRLLTNPTPGHTPRENLGSKRGFFFC